MEALLEKIPEWGALYGMRIVGALAILVFGRLLVGLLTKIVAG